MQPSFRVLYLWMNIPVSNNMQLAIELPVRRPGDHLILRSLMDVVIVLSACPMDVTPINGTDRTLHPILAEVLD
jgi:uncharacterized protein